MQEVYRINTVPGWKPWRGNHEFFLNKETFELAKKLVDDYRGDFHCVPAPTAQRDEHGELMDEDDTLAEWLYNSALKDVQYPYILLGEETYYTE